MFHVKHLADVGVESLSNICRHDRCPEAGKEHGLHRRNVSRETFGNRQPPTQMFHVKHLAGGC